MASPAEPPLERPLSAHGGAGLRVVDRKHRRKGSSVVRPHLDRQSALAGRRQHLFEVEDLCRALRPAEPGESGGSENDRIVFAAFDFPDARVDVPAYIGDA